MSSASKTEMFSKIFDEKHAGITIQFRDRFNNYVAIPDTELVQQLK